MRQLREKYNLDDSSTGCVTKDDIEDVVARWTGVPMTSIKEEEIAKLLRIEEELHKRIISQEKAISALARAIRRSRAGLKASNRPAGIVPVPRTDRRRQDRSGARAGRRSCSAARRAWCASTCPSTWRSTRFPSSSVRLPDTWATKRAAS